MLRKVLIPIVLLLLFSCEKQVIENEDPDKKVIPDKVNELKPEVMVPIYVEGEEVPFVGNIIRTDTVSKVSINSRKYFLIVEVIDKNENIYFINDDGKKHFLLGLCKSVCLENLYHRAFSVSKNDIYLAFLVNGSKRYKNGTRTMLIYFNGGNKEVLLNNYEDKVDKVELLKDEFIYNLSSGEVKSIPLKKSDN